MKQENPLEGIDFNKEKTYIFRLCQTVSPRGIVIGSNGQPTGDSDPPYPPLRTIKNPCLVRDEASGRDRWLRLLNGYDSIWMDEQDSPVKIEPLQASSLQVTISFVSGFLFVKTPGDSNLLKFLLLHDDFKERKIRKSNKPVIFELVNKTASAESELKLMELKDKAIELVKSVKKSSDVQDHISYLNIPVLDEFNQPLPDQMILLNYRKFAESNPSVFIKTFDSAEVKEKFKVKNAIGNGFIDLNKVRGQAHYSDSGALIMVLDVTRDPVEQLTEFAMSKEGASFKKRIQ